MNEPTTQEPAGRPHHLRRRLLGLLFALLVGAGLLLSAPRLASPVLAGRIERELAAAQDGEVSLDHLRLAYPGNLEAGGLRITTEAGETVLDLRSLRARIAPLAYLRGEATLSLNVEGLTVHLWRDAEGAWSLGPPRSTEGGDPAGSPSKTVDDKPAPRPELGLELEATGVTVVLHGTESDPWDGEELQVGLRLRGGLERLDLELESLEIDSAFLRGNLRGELGNAGALLDADTGVARTRLGGELTYVPATLAALLPPDLPFSFTGEAEEQATVRLEGPLEGPLSDLDPLALLAGTTGEVQLGLGEVRTPVLDATGGVGISLAAGAARLEGRLQANGGSLTLTGNAPLDGQGATTLRLEALGLGADTRLAPLLANLHPAFFGVEALEGSTLAGRIGAELTLSLPDGTNLAEWLQADTLPLELLAGDGRFELQDAVLSRSPALSEMLALLGLDAPERFDLRPLEFRLEQGRVSYLRPWTWTLSGTETTFQGTLGLDHSLDLVWNVPVTESLVEKHPFLGYVSQKDLRVPITGSARSPRVEWRSLLNGLAQDAGQTALADVITGEIGDRLGFGKDENGEDPATLLAEADRLWNAGQKTEAAAIYRRLRKDFKVSLIYALNRDRIKSRAKHDG